jgi:hypothetical protein
MSTEESNATQDMKSTVLWTVGALVLVGIVAFLVA